MDNAQDIGSSTPVAIGARQARRGHGRTGAAGRPPAFLVLSPERLGRLRRACADRDLAFCGLNPGPRSLVLYVHTGAAFYWLPVSAPERLVGEDLEEALVREAIAQLDRLVARGGRPAAASLAERRR